MINIKGTVAFIFFLICLSSFSQELPKNFKEKIRKEYNSISNKIKNEELNTTFEKYFTLKKEGLLNKQKFYKSIVNTRSVSNLCDNGTFESGDINSSDWLFYWEGNNGSVNGTNRLNTGNFTGGATPHQNQVHHQVQSIGNDPTFPVLNKVYSFPTGNTKSLRLGNKINGKGMESISKRITITSSTSQLSFSYALVMDNPAGHGTALPFFEVNILDNANTIINYNNLIDLGNGSNRISSNHPLLLPEGNARRKYKDWVCVSADLSSLIGKTVIIEFNNRDCWAGAHFGYTYLDNICIPCDNSPTSEGSIKLGQSDDCDIPGSICVDYTLPIGNNPTISLQLEIIQNGTVVNTINSPVLTSGSSYCFQLTTTNTNGLNTSLQKFDYKIIGKPKLDTFNLSPKIIGNSGEGIILGVNNDYDIFCPITCDDCCKTPLNIWSFYGTPGPLTTTNTTINGVDLSFAQETFELHLDASIPITELRVNITDIQFNYNYDTCATCADNPALWASIYSFDETIGTTPNIVSQSPLPILNTLGSNINNNTNSREIIWENKNGAMLKNQDTFKVSYILPPASEIPCCITSARVCIKISWKDANCQLCEIYTCSNIKLISPSIITELNIKVENDGCCKRILTAENDGNATYLWGTGETTKSILVKNNGTYTVTITNGATTLTKTVIITNILKGNFPTLSYPPQAIPDQGLNFIIRDYSKSRTAPFSYNATKYTLWIFNKWDTDRFNGALRKITATATCGEGFKNGDIYWDGRDNYGNKVQSGEYNFVLRLENCDHKCVSERTTCNEKHSYEHMDKCAYKKRTWQFPIPFPIWKCQEDLIISNKRIGVIDLQW